MVEQNFRVAAVVASFMLPGQALEQQREPAAAAANDDLKIRMAVEDAAGDHAQHAFVDGRVRDYAVDDACAAVFQALQRRVLGARRAVKKYGKLELRNFREERLRLRRIEEKRTVGLRIEQHGAETLRGHAVDLLDRAGNVFQRNGDDAAKAAAVRRDALGDDVVRFARDRHRLVGGQPVGVKTRALADELDRSEEHTSELQSPY